MTYRELVSTLRTTMEGFNSFLEQRDLEGIHAFVKSSFEVMNEPLSMAVYPSSPKGETYSDDGLTGKAIFTLDLFLNEDATPTSTLLLEDYYSSLIEFVHGLSIDGNPLSIDTSTLVRMDDGEMANAILMLISINLNIQTDYGWE